MKKIALAALFCSLLWPSLAVSEETLVSKSHRMTLSQDAPAISLPPVVARVNGVDIFVQPFWGRLLKSAGGAVLASLVDDILLEQEAEKTLGSFGDKKKSASRAQRNISSDVDKKISELEKQFPDKKAFEEQLKASGTVLEDVKRQIFIEIYKEKLLEDKIKVSADEVKKYFDENKERLAVPETVRLKHILVASEQEAKDILLALKVGADFGLMAKEKSKDSASKDRGGDLGFFSPGMLLPQIEQKAFALGVNDTGIVNTPLGFHVIRVAEKRPAKGAVWDAETRQAIERALRQANFQREYPAYIQSLRAKADINVFLKP